MKILQPKNGVDLYKISTTSLQFINFPIQGQIQY